MLSSLFSYTIDGFFDVPDDKCRISNWSVQFANIELVISLFTRTLRMIELNCSDVGFVFVPSMECDLRLLN